MNTEAEAKEIVERFAKRQFSGKYPCPRCGQRTMDENPVRNAMSRVADVYICDECGTSEALESMFGLDTKLQFWAIVLDPTEYR